MKILVFDDDKIHRAAAQVQLKDHDVTVVGTYDEAQDALLPKIDYQRKEAVLVPRVGAIPDRSVSKEVRDEYWAKRDLVAQELEEQFTTYHNFDVVLTDLFVPASKQDQGGDSLRLVGQEMPLGPIIALLAISNGVKRVAVVTDMNHHHHPASAAFNCFKRQPYGGGVGDVRVLCTNRSRCEVDAATLEPIHEILKTPKGEEKYPLRADHSREGTIDVKNWKRVLERLCS